MGPTTITPVYNNVLQEAVLFNRGLVKVKNTFGTIDRFPAYGYAAVSCEGDSGGPVISLSDPPVLYGVISSSTGRGCAGTERPDTTIPLFQEDTVTRADEFKPWISCVIDGFSEEITITNRPQGGNLVFCNGVTPLSDEFNILSGSDPDMIDLLGGSCNEISNPQIPVNDFNSYLFEGETLISSEIGLTVRAPIAALPSTTPFTLKVVVEYVGNDEEFEECDHNLLSGTYVN
ncbi:MAG: trypsin-like serine protease [Synechococcaceae cyanobacterium SM2_3_1]|nr:trypsin-like serine protease [Synechococcaceae cyanobacterium SM2_3_1]